MTYHIRRGRADDFSTCSDLLRHFVSEAGLQESIGYDEDSFLAWLVMLTDKILPGELLVVEYDGRVIGMAASVYSPCFFNRQVLTGAELFWFINPDHRKSGVGKALMEALEACAKHAGVSKFTMVALQALAPERVGKLYEAAGYKLNELAYTKAL